MSEEPGQDEPVTPQHDAEAAAPKDHVEDGQAQEENNEPQDPWAARRELFVHRPTALGGSLVGGNQTGVTGGRVAGDVILGTKVEHHYRFGTPNSTSGDVPRAELDHCARVFAGYEELVLPLGDRLHEERVLVLSGAPFTGRRSAALMLLQSVGAVSVRALDPKTKPTALKDEVSGDSRGYLITDLFTDPHTPLRDIDLWSVRDELVKREAYLIVTVDLYAVLHGVDAVKWEPPSAEAVLRSHLHAVVADPPRERDLLRLAPARDFLAGRHQLREAAMFAEVLAGHACGEASDSELASIRWRMLREQVREWFGDDQNDLRDKAFLIALAAFDEAAYALTAELSDDLYAQFQKTEDYGSSPRVGIFGTSITKRLQLARAEEYSHEEHTEWGPVRQRMARFHEPDTAREVLREVWTGHPSARPALLRWLQRLADDGRPLVRTRAAVTAAVLAAADLPSAMALLIEKWARSRRFRTCLVAANALAMAHAVGAPNIPGILRAWCDAGPSESRLRWTAIRVYALVGAEMPGEALAALADAARKQADVAEAQHIAESIALLLTAESAAVRGQVLRDVVLLIQGEPPVVDIAKRAFILACTHSDDLLVLRWHAESAEQGDSEDARHLAFLLRTVLSDLKHTQEALQAIESWVCTADEESLAERQLTVLLPALARTADDRKRLSHMLRTVRGRRGAHLAVTGRLLNVL
ncbi:MAG: hypothetical protein HOY69_31855 [Streptomyces sp.]|nr:hypothetical protein [Streptomyces sp.]